MQRPCIACVSPETHCQQEKEWGRMMMREESTWWGEWEWEKVNTPKGRKAGRREHQLKHDRQMDRQRKRRDREREIRIREKAGEENPDRHHPAKVQTRPNYAGALWFQTLCVYVQATCKQMPPIPQINYPGRSIRFAQTLPSQSRSAAIPMWEREEEFGIRRSRQRPSGGIKSPIWSEARRQALSLSLSLD